MITIHFSSTIVVVCVHVCDLLSALCRQTALHYGRLMRVKHVVSTMGFADRGLDERVKFKQFTHKADIVVS